VNEAALRRRPCLLGAAWWRVPARLESSRLPNKVMADIGGQPKCCRRVLERLAANVPTGGSGGALHRRACAAGAEAWGFPF